MKRRIPKQIAVVVTVLTLLVALPDQAAAGDSDVAVLLTEVVEQGVVDDDTHVEFWWGADEPRWTGSDEIVFEALRKAGVEPAEPDRVDVSRIYRRPGLSTENAAQLGSLLDAERVLVGEIQYRPLEPVPPLNYPGIEARAEVALVPAGNQEGMALDQFSITRRVYASDGDAALSDARRKAGDALGQVIGRSLQRAGGRVGGRTDGAVLALRDVERAENLEAIRRRLTELDEVESVVERWATEGVIAVELEPAEERDELLEYASRVLEHHEFEDFRAVRSHDPITDDVTEFWVESLEPAR